MNDNAQNELHYDTTARKHDSVEPRDRPDTTDQHPVSDSNVDSDELYNSGRDEAVGLS